MDKQYQPPSAELLALCGNRVPDDCSAEHAEEARNLWAEISQSSDESYASDTDGYCSDWSDWSDWSEESNESEDMVRLENVVEEGSEEEEDVGAETSEGYESL